MDSSDFAYMEIALEEAAKALVGQEVPIGAVIVYKGEIIGRGHNQRESRQSPIAHAEIVAIEEASRTLKRWRLNDSVMYVTLEPCAMCAGAMVLARMKKVCYALADLKGGACGSIFDIVSAPQLNHRVEISTGVFGERSLALLQNFFRQQRKAPKFRRPPVSGAE